MSRPLELDSEALRGPVSRAIGTETIELGEWRQLAIHQPFNQSTGGLYRVSGTARDRGETVSWSLVLKVVQASEDPFGGSDDLSHPNYWKRELLIYRSGVLGNLPGIRAPRCFGVDQREGSTGWIWLEDVTDCHGSRWSPGRYRLAARRLGEFNGAYVAGRPLPSEPHLSRGWLRAFAGTFAPAFAQVQAARDHPMVRRCWPNGLLDRVLGLWEERHALLDALERLPQAFCHLDAFPRNLLVDRRTREVVALDWSYAGIAAVGTELAPMVAASVAFFDAEPEQARHLDEIVFDGYLEGLRAAGWHGDPGMVRLGYTAAASVHYGLFPLGVFMMNEELRARFEQLFAHPAAEIVDRWATLVDFLLDQADEARSLARII